MPYFKYRAKNNHGESVTGKVESTNMAQAASLLHERSLVVVSLTPSSGDGESAFLKSFMGVKQDDIVKITRELATMVEAGLPLTKSLSILEQQSSPAMQKMLSEVVRSIEGGSTFSAALSKQGKVFSKVYIQLIKAGEAAGVLDTVLNQLADTLEKQKEFREKTKGALIYPFIVVLTMMGVGVVMMTMVVPKLSAMYKELNAQMPALTQFFIGISDLMVGYWWLMLPSTVASVMGFQYWIRTKKGQETFDRWLLKAPIIGPLRQKIVLTEFCRTSSLLLTSGISLLEVIDIVSEALGNILYRDALMLSRKKVEKGIPLSQTLNDDLLFPPILRQMTSVGEETGQLDAVLKKLGHYFEAESEHAVKNLTTSLEPLIMVVLGVGVGILVIAIIMPIYNLTTVIQ